MPYLSASAVVIHYEEALYQVYAPLPFTLIAQSCTTLQLYGYFSDSNKPASICYCQNTNRDMRREQISAVSVDDIAEQLARRPFILSHTVTMR